MINMLVHSFFHISMFMKYMLYNIYMFGWIRLDKLQSKVAYLEQTPTCIERNPELQLH